MKQIPSELSALYHAHLNNKAIPKRAHFYYRKWLRYYLNFCLKYSYQQLNKESLTYFIKKLKEKRLYLDIKMENYQRKRGVKVNGDKGKRGPGEILLRSCSTCRRVSETMSQVRDYLGFPEIIKLLAKLVV